VVVAADIWDLNNSSVYAPFEYGMFSWASQISRLILILTARLLSLAVVTRTQQLLRLATQRSVNDAIQPRLFRRTYRS
jgi:hypothetical protein